MSRARELAKVGGLQQTISGVSTHVGISTFASDVYILGKLDITGDLGFDEMTAVNSKITGVSTAVDTIISRNLRVAGLSTFSGLLKVDGAAIEANSAKISDLTNNRIIIAGTGGELEDDANLTFDGTKLFVGVPINVSTGATITNAGNIAAAGIVTANGGVKVGTAVTLHANGNLGITGILTAGKFIGIHTSADGGGIGIGSTTAHVGYGITYIDFKGPGVSTVYSSSVTGITTIYFQGGGGSSVGAAGTWQNDGSQGISTAKNVGINTVGVAVTALQGGQKGGSSGIGASAYGVYLGNGMVITDNELNGDHYIGTAFNGLMAGPVTVNGYITVDGNWAVV